MKVLVFEDIYNKEFNIFEIQELLWRERVYFKHLVVEEIL